MRKSLFLVYHKINVNVNVNASPQAVSFCGIQVICARALSAHKSPESYEAPEARLFNSSGRDQVALAGAINGAATIDCVIQ